MTENSTKAGQSRRRGEWLSRLRHASRRDLLLVVLPALLLIVAAFAFAAHYIKPAPPKQLIVSSGVDGGGYQQFAAAYQAILERDGIELVARPSAGAPENIARLRDETQTIDAGFIQSGTATPQESDRLYSLGAVYYEPLWIFYRASLDKAVAASGSKSGLDQLAQLKGRRIAVGAANSGSETLGKELLNVNGLTGQVKLINAEGMQLTQLFQQGKIDAAFVVGPLHSGTVWTLLYTPGVKLMSLAHADAYSRMFSYLTRLTLPKGSIDMTRGIPANDVQMVSPMAQLVIREGTHPALADLLVQAAAEVHGKPGVFQKPNEFPKAEGSIYPLSPRAERFYTSGKPFLQRYLPFWAANLIDRLIVLLIPLIAVLYPVIRFAPSLYGWRVRSRIYRRYGELKFLEAEIDSEPGQHSREEWLKRLDAIERAVHRLPTPLLFSEMLYNLRGHIDIVRASVLRKTAGEFGAGGKVEVGGKV